MRKDYKGNGGGAWDREAHENLYGQNLNKGLADFLAEEVAPRNFLEFGSGLCALANYLGQRIDLEPSYCIEPKVRVTEALSRGINLINIDILERPAPHVLNQLFDLVLSIEVIEHIPRERHEAVFDFLVSRAGRLIVFSAARPGQGGHGHIAERPEMEWRTEFVERGCCFDPVLTMRARTASNQLNINHRQNLQVFHAPKRTEALLAMETRARPYLQDLLTIVLQSGGKFTGNLFYVDLPGAISGRPEHSLHWKRENLLHLAKNADNILEIGFGAGHSALLCLLANRYSSLTIVDPCEFPHVRSCIAFLKSVFPSRITFIEGNSTERLASLPVQEYDLVHLDGGKEKTIRQDLDLIRPLVSYDHALCIDDTQNAGIHAEVCQRQIIGQIETVPFAKMVTKCQQSHWTHCIARYSEEQVNLASLVIEKMSALYKDVDHPSIYMTSEPSGQARAHFLIKAIRHVEALGLCGCFVEVGVAAGHSSVIAALSVSRYFPRDFFLYDTFAGFGPDLPEEKDLNNVSIRDYDLSKYEGASCASQAVRAQIEAAGQRRDALFLIEGYAQDTIPKIKPHSIAILRLDANLFDPTYAALCELYDLVEPGGYIIVDDYGHWKGCAQAVEKFFKERGQAFPGKAIDYTCYGWQK